MHDQQEFCDFCKVLQKFAIQTYSYPTHPNNQLQHVLELKSNQNPLDYHHFPMKNGYSWGYSLPDRPIFLWFSNFPGVRLEGRGR